MSTIEECMKVFEGMTPEEIAHFLKFCGVKGRQNDPKYCVIAEYLREKHVEFTSVNYGGIYKNGVLEYTNQVNIKMFMNNFDKRKYQDLLE